MEAENIFNLKTWSLLVKSRMERQKGTKGKG